MNEYRRHNWKATTGRSKGKSRPDRRRRTRTRLKRALRKEHPLEK